MAVGRGPVYPVLFHNAVDGGLDRTSGVFWVAPRPLGGVAIVRGHRLGAPQEPIGFLDQNPAMDPVMVLDPASAQRIRGDNQGRWWASSRLRAGVGCYGLQIDGPRFSKVIVIQFRS